MNKSKKSKRPPVTKRPKPARKTVRPPQELHLVRVAYEIAEYLPETGATAFLGALAALEHWNLPGCFAEIPRRRLLSIASELPHAPADAALVMGLLGEIVKARPGSNLSPAGRAFLLGSEPELS